MRVLAISLALALVLVCSAHASRPQPRKVAKITRRVFGSRWRTAACIVYTESRDELDPPHNNLSRGPFQIYPPAHPWVNVRRLTTSWLYSARVAYRISAHGTDWGPWNWECGA